MLRINLLLLALYAGHLLAQTPSRGFALHRSFDVGKNERIDRLSPNCAGKPVLYSSEAGKLFIRPLNPLSGIPEKLLSIRSNNEKKVEQYEQSGDTIITLVRSLVLTGPDYYELVVFSITGDTLRQLKRIRLELSNPTTVKVFNKAWFSISPNGRQAQVLRKLSYSQGKDARFHLEVIDIVSETHRMEILPLPYDADDCELLGATVDNFGNTYFMTKVGVKLNSPFIRKFLVYAFDHANRRLHEYDPQMNKIFIQETLIKTTATGIHVVGLYATDPFAEAKSTGYIAFGIDSVGGSIVYKSVNAFDQAMISVHNTEDNSDAPQTISDLYINKIVDCDGRIISLMEKRFREQICTTDPRTGIITCTDLFHFNGISMVDVMAPSLTMTIGRRQTAYNRITSGFGYTSLKSGGSLIILYNDNPRNTTSAAERMMDNLSRSKVRYMSYRCKSNAIVIDEVNPMEQSGYWLHINTGAYTNDNRIFALFTNGREYRLGIMLIDETRSW
ncbi:MAG: hypothetical protein Kow0075_13230 [Salibacteraceae bacterium]